MADQARKIKELEQQIAILQKKLARHNHVEPLPQLTALDYRVLFEHAFDPMFVLDADQNYVDANLRAVELIEYDRQELLTMSVFDLIPEEQQERSRQQFSQLKARGHYESFIGKLVCKDGKQLDIEVNSSAIYAEDKIIGSIDICRDITERLKVDAEIKSRLESLVNNRTTDLEKTNRLLIEKIKQRQLAEEAWQASEDKLRRIIDNMRKDYFLYSRNHSGEYAYVSPSIRDVLGYSPHTFQLHSKNFLTTSSLNERALKAIHKCLKGQQQPFIEQEYFDKDGNIHILELSEVPLYDAKGNISGSEGIAHDITNRKKMELELLKTQKLESTGLLAGGIAHDFNNMLSAILGNISLAKIYAEPDSKVYKKLEETEKASWRARDLTQQLLTFAKGGAPVTRPESIELMVKDSAWFTLRGSNVKCDYTAEQGLWSVEVDEGQICQVIQNIAHNADQCMPNGGTFTIHAENTVIDEDSILPIEGGRYVKITLTDTGPGIPKKVLSKIFDPYYTTKKQGSGLGLAISYSIIKNHGGLLTAESKVGKGTTFHIYLPFSGVVPITTHQKEDQVIRTGTGRILIMDDDQVVREIGKEMLEHLGYRPATASDGDQAIKMYREAMADNAPFDAVIMDLTIPGGMGGQETMDQLLKIDPLVKGIVSSGYANDEIMNNYEQYGFKAIIPKPYKIERLGMVLDSVLKNSHRP
ncbi:MAG: PAS domain S-box protein [Proteobacteria bacterium]|nr:PAS domain S-box protein [Pseudomonadota bacterium]MBU1686458.1 PAS domain S-box protein [Pseudomonadota bacterium]